MTWSFAGLVLLWSFGAGYLWRQWRAKATAAPALTVEASEEERAEALRLLDRAVQSKFSELWNEAARFAFEAQQADDATPGVDVFIGELALEREEIDVMGSAARAALRRQPMCANAKLLLALQVWILAGQSGGVEAGASATQLLQEAANDEPSNGAVRFFTGDILRAVGRPAEAHAQLLGALYRQHEWHSAALITAKLFLAAEETGSSAGLNPLVFPGSEGETFGASATALLRSIRSAGDLGAATSALLAVFTVKQICRLYSDQGLTFAGEALTEFSDLDLSLPYVEMTNPAEKPK